MSICIARQSIRVTNRYHCFRGTVYTSRRKYYALWRCQVIYFDLKCFLRKVLVFGNTIHALQDVIYREQWSSWPWSKNSWQTVSLLKTRHVMSALINIKTEPKQITNNLVNENNLWGFSNSWGLRLTVQWKML